MDKFDMIYCGALMIALTALCANRLLSHSEKKAMQKIGDAAATLAIALMLTAGFFLCVELTAKSHGATTEMLNEMALHETINTICNSHKESKNLPDEFKDCYILYYKFSCPDCRETYQDFQEYLNANPLGREIYYIPTTSETGRDLLGKYGATHVPSLVYIHPNGRTFTTKRIYADTKNGAVLDTVALNELLQTASEVQPHDGVN